MAGDWIKMRVDLADDPAVVRIAESLHIEEDAVVGKLHRLWAWANRHTVDGKTDGINAAWVDRHVTAKGFAGAMVQVGWLVVSEQGIAFPGFEKHNGVSAKRRCNDQLRQRLSRSQRDAGVTGVTRDIIPRPFVRRVLQRDNYTCVYCGEQSDENQERDKRHAQLSIDHIVPNGRGGKTAVECLATACRACNNEKNDRTPKEWGMPPAFLQPGLRYDENRCMIVTDNCDAGVTTPLPEKRREEKKKKKTPPTPPKGGERERFMGTDEKRKKRLILREGDAKVLRSVWLSTTGAAVNPEGAVALVEQFSLGAVLGAIEPAYARWKKQGEGRPFTWGWVGVQLQQPKIIERFKSAPPAEQAKYKGSLEARAEAWWGDQDKTDQRGQEQKR